MTRADAGLFVALLAGGRGTRFWPLSRRARPKQLLDLTGEGPLIVVTRDRMAGLCPPRNVLVVTTEDLAPATTRLLRLPRRNVVAEPAGRNTAAAVALAALVAHVRDPEAVVLAVPADHAVLRPERLRAAFRRGVAAARRLDGIVLFGEKAREPETNYGYITPARGAATAGVRRVARFREKPSTAVARRLAKVGALWNCGMFCGRAATLLDEIARALPALAAGLEDLRPHVDRPTFQRALARIHPKLPAISFDHGVLEPSRRVHVLPIDVGWSDVGTWEALARRLHGDAAGNRGIGSFVFEGSRGCLAVTPSGGGRTLVMLGVSDLVLVDAGDVVLACPRGSEAAARKLLTRLEHERPEIL